MLTGQAAGVLAAVPVRDNVTDFGPALERNVTG
jgi:hypothetical protein